MKTLKIDLPIPAGYEIDTWDPLAGVLKLKEKAAKPMKVTDRIKTINDVLIDNNINIDDFNDAWSELEPDEKAYAILKLLAKSLNEGWTPDWSNANELKYYPYFEMKGSSGFRFLVCDGWFSYSRVGSRLCFKSRELAEYAGKQFTDVYKQFMVID